MERVDRICLNGEDLWTVNRYMSAFTDYGRRRIPHLNKVDGTKTSTGKEP